MPSESDRQKADREAGGGTHERETGNPTGARPSDRALADQAERVASLLVRLEQLHAPPARPAGRQPVRTPKPRPPALPSSSVSLPALTNLSAPPGELAVSQEQRRGRRPLLAGIGAGLIVGCTILLLGQWSAQDNLLQQIKGLALSAGAALTAALGLQSPAERTRGDGQDFVAGQARSTTRTVARDTTGAGSEPGATESGPAGVASRLPWQPGLAQSGNAMARSAEDVRQQPRASETGSVARPPPLALSPKQGLDTGSTCDITVEQSQTASMRLGMVDPSRAGSAMIVKVDGLDYRATFASDGRLSLAVPRLSPTPALAWTRGDGTPCRHVAAVGGASMPLQIALIWSGNGDLDMHVVEPNAWVGSPHGHVHAGQPNSEGTTAHGRLMAFGAPGDPTRVQLYAVERSLLGDSGSLNVTVRLDGSQSCAKAEESAQLRYEVQVRHVDAQGNAAQMELRSFAFDLPPCPGSLGSAERSERITVKF